MAAIEDPSFGIKINGKISSWINGKSGLRQGCPLSPFLFVICIEMLTRMIKREELHGNTLGISVAPSSSPISHLLFADDMVFLTKANPDTCSRLMNVIRDFCDRREEHCHVE